MIPTLADWFIRRPHVVVVPLLSLLLFLMLLLLPATGWGPSAPSQGAHVGTPPGLPDGVRLTPTPPDLTVWPGCSDLMALESPAELGQLSIEQVACLEDRYLATGPYPELRKVSLLLIANANGAGDKAAWGTLVLRHLEEVDRSNPDISYSYAIHLARKGPRRGRRVIFWSNNALENRAYWEGDTYDRRVHSLYRLRASAAKTLWERAIAREERQQLDDPDPRVDRARSRLQEYSRDWYQVADAMGRDTDIPWELCLSVSPSTEFCEQG